MTLRFDTNNIHLSDDELRNLLIYSAREIKLDTFRKIYKEFYKDSTEAEMYRVIFFIRLASGLDGEFRDGLY